MRVQQILSAFALTLLGMLEARAAEMGAEDYSCGNRDTDIATDRPDVTNSSRVVPHESVQVENGINWTTRQDATVFYGGYVQVPWSKEIGDGWSLSGMFTGFLMPGGNANNPTWEPTFAVERQLGSRADFFVEYVADRPRRGASSQIFDCGGAYRNTPTQQIDFRVGFGLNRAAPDYAFGVGYSFRFDHVI